MSTGDHLTEELKQRLAHVAEKARESVAHGEGYKWGPSTDQVVRRTLGRWHYVPRLTPPTPTTRKNGHHERHL